MSEPMMELWQAEWCPASGRVRERLTELGVAFVVRQVPADREDRDELEALTGGHSIPVLVAGGDTIGGEQEILAFLDARFTEPATAAAHRARAQAARAKQAGQTEEDGYTISAATAADFADAVESVRAELASEGFGVLCEIDVQATLKDKLGIDGEPYTILGACNPPLAHAALGAEIELGALLPCNVIVYRQHGQMRIAAIDAERMLSIVANDQLTELASQVKRRLGSVVERAAATVASDGAAAGRG